MSIQSEVSRLQSAKASLAAAIEAKGVSVPETTKLDGYSDLVAEIDTSGGETTVFRPMPSNLVTIESPGIYYPASNAPIDKPEDIDPIFDICTGSLDMVRYHFLIGVEVGTGTALFYIGISISGTPIDWYSRNPSNMA